MNYEAQGHFSICTLAIDDKLRVASKWNIYLGEMNHGAQLDRWGQMLVTLSQARCELWGADSGLKFGDDFVYQWPTAQVDNTHDFASLTFEADLPPDALDEDPLHNDADELYTKLFVKVTVGPQLGGFSYWKEWRSNTVVLTSLFAPNPCSPNLFSYFLPPPFNFNP